MKFDRFERQKDGRFTLKVGLHLKINNSKFLIEFFHAGTLNASVSVRAELLNVPLTEKKATRKHTELSGTVTPHLDLLGLLPANVALFTASNVRGDTIIERRKSHQRDK